MILAIFSQCFSRELNMREQRFWFFCILLLISLFSCKRKEGLVEENAEKEPEWVQIFNGKDLSGWKVKIKGYPLGENFGNTFRAEDGVIRVDYEAYDEFADRFGHLFFEMPYSRYRLRLEYRFLETQAPGGQEWARKNSGIMIHSQAPERMGRDQDFPVSVEVQLLGGLNEGESRPTANMCSPGTHIMIGDSLITEHCVNSVSETFYGDAWIGLELLVLSDSLIVHKVNGKEVMRYSRPTFGGEYSMSPEMEGEPLTFGYIALQSESHPIEFRDIELLNLEEESE